MFYPLHWLAWYVTILSANSAKIKAGKSAMVGVPSSRGCNTCRKAKKKCDLAKPKCGRCTRVGDSCTGGGLQRFRFHEYKPIVAPPSNGTTQLASKFVSMIGITDERYSFELYGPRFFKGLPQRFGSHAALDDMTSAVIASFQSVRLRKESNSKALALYGKALRSLQTCLQDSKQPVMLKLELVIMMMLCQLWVENKHANKHRGVIAYLVKEVVTQGDVIDSDDLRGFCLQVVYAALCDPKVELGPWYWDVAVQDTIIKRPYHYEQGLYSFELGAIGDLPIFLRDPERYLYQLKCYYNMLSQERPIMRDQYEKAIPLALAPNANSIRRIKAIEYAAGHSILLIQTALVGPTIEPFGVLPNYTQEFHQVCDEAIVLAQQCQTFRPCGSSWAPELLKMVWAALEDGYRHNELEELMDKYAEDVQGSDYLEEAKAMRKRFDQLGWSDKQRFLSETQDGQAAPPCVIL